MKRPNIYVSRYSNKIVGISFTFERKQDIQYMRELSRIIFHRRVRVKRNL
jgi:hypothetical protein